MINHFYYLNVFNAFNAFNALIRLARLDPVLAFNIRHFF